MKKLFSVFLAIMMLFSMSLAAAEEAALKPLEVSTEEAVELPDLSGITAPDYDAYMEEDKGDISIKGLVTHDTVAISGSQYQVLTPTGILFTYTAPSGVVALTQDYVQQATLFSSYYSNPLEVVSKWIDNGMHLNVYYSTNDVDVVRRFVSSMMLEFVRTVLMVVVGTVVMFSLNSSLALITLCMVVPVALHGAYDYIASMEEASGWFFVGFIAILFLVSYRLVTKMSREDSYIG